MADNAVRLDGRTSDGQGLSRRAIRLHARCRVGTKGLRILASSCPKNRTYYAAAQVMTNGIGGEILAIVCKVLWSPNSKTGENFGYKDSAPLRR